MPIDQFIKRIYVVTYVCMLHHRPLHRFPSRGKTLLKELCFKIEMDTNLIPIRADNIKSCKSVEAHSGTLKHPPYAVREESAFACVEQYVHNLIL